MGWYSSTEYDYDYNGPEGGHCECDYICRCSVYEGLRVSSVDESQLETDLKGLANIPDGDPLPPELQEAYDTYHDEWADPENWWATGVRGYYGEEVEIEPPDTMIGAARAYYRKQFQEYNLQLKKLGFPAEQMPRLY